MRNINQNKIKQRIKLKNLQYKQEDSHLGGNGQQEDTSAVIGAFGGPINLRVANAADEGHRIIANGEQGKHLSALRSGYYLGGHGPDNGSYYWSQTADHGSGIEEIRVAGKVEEQAGYRMCPGSNEDDDLEFSFENILKFLQDKSGTHRIPPLQNLVHQRHTQQHGNHIGR